MNASIKYGVALVAALAMFGTTAQAALIETNPTIVSGGITFSDFTAVVTGQGDRGPTTNVGTVDVTGLAAGPGIQFSSGFNAVYIDGYSYVDAKITYTASGTAGVSQVGLNFDATFMGFAIASVTETIYSNANFTGQVGKGIVSCGFVTLCESGTTETSVALNGSYNTLYVTKDILLRAYREGASTETSVVTQTWGNPTPVPEPMSIALFGTGLVGLGLVRRARKSA
jgi:hypothetical protein